MYTGALLVARVSELYFASYDTKFGACGSLYNLAEDGRTNHTIKVYSGVYADESKKMLQQFFNDIRRRTN
jgi:tRNA(adenine34) deaminase